MQFFYTAQLWRFSLSRIKSQQSDGATFQLLFCDNRFPAPFWLQLIYVVLCFSLLQIFLHAQMGATCSIDLSCIHTATKNSRNCLYSMRCKIISDDYTKSLDHKVVTPKIPLLFS